MGGSMPARIARRVVKFSKQAANFWLSHAYEGISAVISLATYKKIKKADLPKEKKIKNTTYTNPVIG